MWVKVSPPSRSTVDSRHGRSRIVPFPAQRGGWGHGVAGTARGHALLDIDVKMVQRSSQCPNTQLSSTENQAPTG